MLGNINRIFFFFLPMEMQLGELGQLRNLSIPTVSPQLHYNIRSTGFLRQCPGTNLVPLMFIRQDSSAFASDMGTMGHAPPRRFLNNKEGSNLVCFGENESKSKSMMTAFVWGGCLYP